MQKKANPKASAYRNDLSGGGNFPTQSQVASAASADTPINQGDEIQKIGWRPIRTSRSVPPPVAVTIASTSTPTGSRDLRAAASAPLAAKTATPAILNSKTRDIRLPRSCRVVM